MPLAALQEDLLEIYFYFLKFICGILNWGMATSFWNYMIQISIRLMNFQNIYSRLRKLQILKGLSHEIDFYNVDENLQMLALIRAAAGLWIFWRHLWFLVEIKHVLSGKC